MELHAKMSETDLAYIILKNAGQPVHYKELIEKILEVKPMEGRDIGHIMAGIHTEINLDYRFVHLGGGLWGLRKWSPEEARANQEYEEDLDEN